MLLQARAACQSLAVSREEPALKDLFAARQLDGEVDGIPRGADLAGHIVLLAALVRVIRAADLAVVVDLEGQRSRAPAVIVKLVRTAEGARIKGRAGGELRRFRRRCLRQRPGHEIQPGVTDRLQSALLSRN